MFERRKTRLIKVGGVKIGSGAPISVQSMAKTDTRDIVATVRQIKKLEKAGCDIVRVAVKDAAAAKAIRAIKEKIRIPLVADIHFHYNLAIEAINAGADKIRLNPGNIKKKEDIAQVIKLARQKKIPIRIGINSGSLPDPRRSMASSALEYIKIFESMDFRDIIISLKSSDVAMMIGAYRDMAGICDYPFHLGVTAAGPASCGIIKSSVGIGALLYEGIGDTIRVSLTGDPVEEVRAGIQILRSLGLRKEGVEIISCPTCGRCEVDLVKVVKEFEGKVQKLSGYPSGLTSWSKRGPRGDCHHTMRLLKVAIMGCVVNGPGEAKDADIGIAAGKKSGMLFKKGKPIRKIAEKDFVKVLLNEMDKILNTNA
ncbi:MAG: flavodoxin-dependent (E)-4-hydroxy-3-methylbut-2-enyl-diphosphate synthase [Candidatus Omnitrophica bacterium]|nr:flavodoxin-dependent (E)-4-hydroxy-3-methylbut-2-enyl-diphosphate synthase [Candidatus Omnitrophota bacterium]